MQYFRNSQNNRLVSPLPEKEAYFAAELDTASDSSFQKPVSQLKAKRSSQLPSPAATHIASMQYDCTDERDLLRQEQEVEPCISFFSCGYCPEGSSCSYTHCLKTIWDIKKESKAKLNVQLVLDFPELMGVVFSRRIPSFLQ